MMNQPAQQWGDQVAVSVKLRNQKTGEIKTLKVGFSWMMFLLAPTLGIGLFMRRLYLYGGIVVAVQIANILMSFIPTIESSTWFEKYCQALAIGMCMTFGLQGNALTAVHYLKNGWEWADPTSDDTAFAKKKWKIA
jgi:hypothetical protein